MYYSDGFIDQFETLTKLAQEQQLLQREYAYSQALKRERVYKKKAAEIRGLPDGTLQPTRSIHVIDFGAGQILRVSRSKRERRKELALLLDLAKKNGLDEIVSMFDQMKGVNEPGSRIHWYCNGNTPQVVDYESYEHYFSTLEEEKFEALALYEMVG